VVVAAFNSAAISGEACIDSLDFASGCPFAGGDVPSAAGLGGD
jgi:hypothetical protein